jgi:hypothetical protein
LLALGGRAERAAARRLLADLHGAQLADGGWASDAVMLVPAPRNEASSPDDRAVPDDRRVFTAANVLSAIAAVTAADGHPG